MINYVTRLVGLVAGSLLLCAAPPPLSAMTLNEAAKLLADDGAAADQLGFAVAVDGDTAVIGAPYDDTGSGGQRGSAYVFVRAAGVWTLQQKLLPASDLFSVEFGSGVDVAGDTIVVADRSDRETGNNAGAVFVYSRSNGAWNQDAKLTGSDTVPSDGFGWSVSLDGDSLIAGARQDGTRSGAAYVFTRDSGLWPEQAKLVPPDGGGSDEFGWSVAIDGDTAVIGARLHDAGGLTNPGAAYIYQRTAGTWALQQKIAGAVQFGQFGFAVDVDADSALLSEIGDSSFAGAASVYVRSNGAWTEQARLVAADGEANDLFGASVALHGDTAVLSAPRDDDTAANAGAAYVFTRSGTVWTEAFKLLASDGQADDGLGYSGGFSNKAVAVSGATILAGAAAHDALGGNSGTAYVFATAAQPVADAGPDLTTDEGASVMLDGTGSSGAASFSWSQIAGPAVTLSDAGAGQPDFAAPFVASNTTLTFALIVEDGEGTASDPDTVDITVVSINNPPVADAGNDGTIKEGAVAQLDGSNSFDPEGDMPLNYAWTQVGGPAVTLNPSASAASPSFTAPSGIGNQLVFALVVDDGREFSVADQVTVTVVENSAPVADAGADITADEGSLVMLNGAQSSDPDGGDTLTYEWMGPVALDDATSPSPSFSAPAVGPGGADYAFELRVTDDDPVNPKSASDKVIVSVRNTNDPPSCELARASCPASKIRDNEGCTLWPPNHKLTEVSIAGVTDADSMYNSVDLRITGVTQDEPVNGGGDGDSSPDAVLQDGAVTDTVLIRAERTGQGGQQENGRVYTVSYTADDGFEHCSGTVTVGVPHDRKDVPIDDGQQFDSTQP